MSKCKVRIFIAKNRGWDQTTIVRENIMETEKRLRSLFHITTVERADRIVVLGGDGTMVDMIKKYAHHRIPFVGLNHGTFGFLMNKVPNLDEDLLSIVIDSPAINFPMIKVQVEFLDGKESECLAFNDVYTKTAGSQSARHDIYIIDETGNATNLLKKYGYYGFNGDGIIICTPGGCTAYNRAAGGHPIMIEDQAFGLTPINPFIPNRETFRPQLISNKLKIEVLIQNDPKRHHLVIADNKVFRRVNSFVVSKADIEAAICFNDKNGSAYHVRTLKQFALRG